jgi:hypothetical protein
MTSGKFFYWTSELQGREVPVTQKKLEDLGSDLESFQRFLFHMLGGSALERGLR